MSKKVRLKSDFVWDEVKLKAAEGLAKGEMLIPLANSLGINERTLRRWNDHPDFKLKVSAIIADIDISMKSERIKIAKKIIRAQTEDIDPKNWTKKDILEWLKYVGEETGDYEPVQKVKHEISLSEKIKQYEQLFSEK